MYGSREVLGESRSSFLVLPEIYSFDEVKVLHTKICTTERVVVNKEKNCRGLGH